VRGICVLGDKILVEETGKQFKKEKDLKKGNFNTFNVLMGNIL